MGKQKSLREMNNTYKELTARLEGFTGDKAERRKLEGKLKRCEQAMNRFEAENNMNISFQ